VNESTLEHARLDGRPIEVLLSGVLLVEDDPESTDWQANLVVAGDARTSLAGMLVLTLAGGRLVGGRCVRVHRSTTRSGGRITTTLRFRGASALREVDGSTAVEQPPVFSVRVWLARALAIRSGQLVPISDRVNVDEQRELRYLLSGLGIVSVVVRMRLDTSIVELTGRWPGGGGAIAVPIDTELVP
jgi:hypothetical protein